MTYSGLVATIVRFFKYSHSGILIDSTYHTELLIWTCLELGVYLMAPCFPTYRPLVPRVIRFVSFASLLGRSLKKDSGDMDLPTVGWRSKDTTGGRKFWTRLQAGNDKISLDDGDKRVLANSYLAEEESAEAGGEGFNVEDLHDDNRVQDTNNNITVGTWNSSDVNR